MRRPGLPYGSPGDSGSAPHSEGGEAHRPRALAPGPTARPGEGGSGRLGGFWLGSPSFGAPPRRGGGLLPARAARGDWITATSCPIACQLNDRAGASFVHLHICRHATSPRGEKRLAPGGPRQVRTHLPRSLAFALANSSSLRTRSSRRRASFISSSARLTGEGCGAAGLANFAC